ncbi:hypothetical protein N9L68_01495 [bacterium]|nr:hypothetical protein [bacterium]
MGDDGTEALAFEAHRSIGDWAICLFARFQSAAEETDQKARKELGLQQDGASAKVIKRVIGKLPAPSPWRQPGDGFEWCCIGPRAAGLYNKVDVQRCGHVDLGDFAIARALGQYVVLSFESSDAPDKPGGPPTVEELDSRVLGIRGLGGRRQRHFKDVVGAVVETDWSAQGLPISGPRTFRWVAQFIWGAALTPWNTTPGSAR